MKNYLLISILAILIIAIAISGCIMPSDKDANGEVCAQVITYAVSPTGQCEEFPTSCIPEGYVRVDSCQPDLCEGVTCSDKCEGFTRYENGTCNTATGNCNYETVTQNSTECGYQEPTEELDFETTLVNCDYLEETGNLHWFFSIKNTGTRATEAGATVWLVGGNKEDNFNLVSNSYAPGISLWNDQFASGYTEKGNIWRDSIDRAAGGDFAYKLIYCEEESPYTTCTETNGIVLYSGNTANDCD